MLKKPENPQEGMVACRVCLLEIPQSVASSQEGSDYVLYFCGENCFEKWKLGVKEPDKPDTQSG